jgi:hypothetical protein
MRKLAAGRIPLVSLCVQPVLGWLGAVCTYARQTSTNTLTPDNNTAPLPK